MRWLPLAVIALGLAAAWALPQVVAQEPLTWKRDNKGDAIAIQITADDAVTWPEGGKRLFLLKGKVWIEQGGDTIRVPQAVVWVDEEGKKTSGIYRINVYGEGGVSLEVAAKTHQAPTGQFELNTRGEIKIKTYKSKVTQKSGPDQSDPLYQHALAALKSSPAPIIQQASFQQPVEPQPAPTPPQAPQVFQPPTTPVPPGPPGSGASPVPVIPPPAPGTLPPQPPKTPDAAAPQPLRGSISIVPRSSVPFKYKDYPMPNGEKAVVFSPGIIVRIENPQVPPKETIIVQVEADRVVLWTHGDVRDLVEGGSSSTNSGRELEFYLHGNVQITTFFNKEAKVIRCSEAYYDVNRNVAIALDADLEVQEPLMQAKLHMITPELHQENENVFTARTVKANGSTLPYAPGLDIWAQDIRLEEKKVLRKSIFGVQFYDPRTGEPEYETQRIFTGWNVFPEIEGVPFFYLPYLQGDVNDPLGPLQSLSVGYSKIFGFQFFSSFNVFDLLGIDPPPGQRLRLNLDYLSARGPEIGVDYGAFGKELFGVPGKYEANVTSMYINDKAADTLGGNRGIYTLVDPLAPIAIPITHPSDRGRFNGNLNWQDLPNGFTIKTQLALVSDRNFLDQYYNQDWVNGLNQETYFYVQQRQNNMAWDMLLEQRLARNWITETDSLPNFRGYWLGQDFLDLFSNNLKAGAGYFHLEPTRQPPPPFEVTDVNTETGRFDVWDELSLPFQAGAFKLVPYGLLEGAYYTRGITSSDEGRFMYGGGLRGSIPFSRLYPEVNSELFNLDGMYHKIVLSGDYYFAHSSRRFTSLPQLDQLNDNESDQALRDIRAYQPSLNPANATMLNSGFFDPQFFALRKLLQDKVDTLDSMDELTLDLRQRWQTKRGFPGQEHIVDWMTLDLSASFFPQPNRDNFGETVNFLQYDWSWSIGDRTTLFSSGWFDPHPGAARTWNFGAELNRPDRTSIYLGYREIDPLESKMVIASVTLPFSSKYTVTASTSYDFGVNTQINSLMLTRTGSDLIVSLGFTYNSIVNNFGFAFEIYPNLLPPPHTGPLALAR
jgi:hypothetical protein